MRIAPPCLLLALALLAPAARAETTACTVLSSLPATIAAPGHYCLEADFAVAGVSVNGITIGASDVVLDCNDHAITATAADNSGAGVRVGGASRRVTVRNCRIVGFDNGIGVNYENPTPVPRSMRVTGNRIEGPVQAGIWIYGSGNLIEGNYITGVRGGVGIHPSGIYLDDGDRATGNVVRDNTVVDIHPTYSPPSGFPLTIGLNINRQNDALLEGNTVTGLRGRTDGGVYGIVTAFSTGVVARDNTVLSVEPGAAPYDGGNWSGIFMQGTAEEQATNACVDNHVGHFNGNITGCTKAGNTEF